MKHHTHVGGSSIESGARRRSPQEANSCPDWSPRGIARPYSMKGLPVLETSAILMLMLPSPRSIFPAYAWCEHFHGNQFIVLVCKTTYDLRPGECPPSEAMVPICTSDKFDNPEATDGTVRAPSDLVPYKRPEVLVVGTAHPPPDTHPSKTSFSARLSVGDVDKSVEVWGDRCFDRDGNLKQQGVRSIPLLWEYAAADDDDNPVGLRPGYPDSYGRIRLPNFTALGCAINNSGAVVAPAGFAPLAAKWPRRVSRKERGERALATASSTGSGLIALSTAFNTAPEDQFFEESPEKKLRISLEGFHLGLPRMDSFVQLVPLSVAVHDGQRTRRQPAVPDTILIDTDRAHVCVTWRSAFLCEWDPRDTKRIEVDFRNGAAPSRTSQNTALPKTEPDLDFSDGGSPSILPTRSEKTDAPRTRVDVAAAPPHGDGLPFQTPDPRTTPLEKVAPHPPPPPMYPVVSERPQYGSPHGAETEAAVAPQAVSVGELAGRGASGYVVAPALEGRDTEFGPLIIPSSSSAVVPPECGVLQLRLDPYPLRSVELLWFEPATGGRLREVAEWRTVLAKAKDLAPEGVDYDGPAARSSNSVERQEMWSVLACGSPLSVEEAPMRLRNVTEQFRGAKRSLALIEGLIEVQFDELEELKATMAAAGQHAASNDRLRSVITEVHDIFKTPWAQQVNLLLESLSAKLREATTSDRKLAMTADEFRQQVRAGLAQNRHFQRRFAFGEKRLRVILVSSDGAHRIPAYLPEQAARDLPSFERFHARCVGEVRPVAEQGEPAAVAMRLLTLGRTLD